MILIVDDEPMICLTLTELLEDVGYEVIGAGNGVEARARFGPQVAAVLLDVRLPDVGQLELLTWFKSQNPACVVLMMTGNGPMALEAEARGLGANGFLRKPFSIDSLLRDIERLVPRA
ncbi:MAG: response regulator [Myxococcota bacterium]